MSLRKRDRQAVVDCHKLAEEWNSTAWKFWDASFAAALGGNNPKAREYAESARWYADRAAELRKALQGGGR